MPDLLWKPDWAEARAAFTAWWNHRGLAVAVTAPKDRPWEEIPVPAPVADVAERWRNIAHWAGTSLAQLARTYWGGAAFPNFNSDIGGPGSLGLFLGCAGHPAPNTMWYSPCITDPATHPTLRFDPANASWKLHVALLETALRQSQTRYLVGFPDLIENLDTLAQLRDPQQLLLDLVERPGWVRAKLAEINRAFFDSYQALWERVRDPWGGSAYGAFLLWGPGKVAKLQCDFSCMISAAMFREFVVPGLTEQCDRLDYTLYHLDGTTALHHLPALLEIEALAAIEWTPQAGLPGGGSPRWYELYRQIKSAGKSVQAVGVAPAEIEPLIEAVGPAGLYIWSTAASEAEARDCLRRVGWKGGGG